MVDVQRDPEAVETAILHRMSDPTGAQILEIGCGEGRLTWRYAAVTARVCGIDTNALRLANAIRTRPEPLASKVHFVLTRAETLPFADQTFTLVLFAWSL